MQKIKSRYSNDPEFGKTLWLSDGMCEIGAALDCGIRILHCSCRGMDNLFYRQPADDRKYITDQGWRLYGGHRIWAAPESEKSYYPDNQPVDYELKEDGVLLRQKDPWLKIEKSLKLTFLSEGCIQVDHEIRNLADVPLTCSVWGISTLAAGGTLQVQLADNDSEYTPKRLFALWKDTSLQDPRIRIKGDFLWAEHQPSETFFKLGLYTDRGTAIYRRSGQRFICRFGGNEIPYPDGNSNFELYLSQEMMELETLGGLQLLNPGKMSVHQEIWQIEKDTR